MRCFKLTIEYDGTAYHGWQRQLNQKTVQGEIERALSTITGTSISLSGSGRTDAGVHALGQTASFKCQTRLSSDVFKNALNSLLEQDIVITDCEEANLAFHARYNVISKIYEYHIFNRPLPKAVGRQYCWHIRKKLDVDSMKTAIEHIIGRHDFSAFEGTGSPKSTSVREVFHARLLLPDQENIVFRIEADGFLKYMVRNIVGTLVEIGFGKKSSEDMKTVLMAKNRGLAGPTAPPDGLFLVEVKY